MMISKEIRINQRSMELYKKMALQIHWINLFLIILELEDNKSK